MSLAYSSYSTVVPLTSLTFFLREAEIGCSRDSAQSLAWRDLSCSRLDSKRPSVVTQFITACMWSAIYIAYCYMYISSAVVKGMNCCRTMDIPTRQCSTTLHTTILQYIYQYKAVLKSRVGQYIRIYLTAMYV